MTHKPLRICGRLLVLACVLALLCSGTASAGDGLVDVNATVGADADVDGVTNVTDATLDAATNVSVSSDALDTEADVTAETNASESGATGTADTSTNVSDATVSAETTADTADTSLSAETDANLSDADATLSVDANTADMSLYSSVDADKSVVDGPVLSDDVSPEGDEPASIADGAGDARAGPGPAADGTARPDDDGPTAGTTDSSSPADGGGAPVPSGGSEPAAAVGLVAVAGTAATRRGLSAVGSGSAPLAALRDAAVAAVHWLRANVPALVPLRYSRYDDSDPLAHETRAALYDAVETAPGINLSALETRTDASLSSVRHHLRILEEESLVESERIRGKRRYFPANAANPELRAALDEPATASVLRTLAAMEAATVTDLAERLGRDPSTISHHLSRLEEDGLVERERDGQAVLTRLADEPRRVLGPEERADALGTAD